MAELNETQDTKHARAFFARAKEAAGKQNFDYAINMYLEGLHLDPDNIEEGHIPLRRLAILRQSRKGKKPTMVERVKHLRGKDPLEQMLNAEYLIAKDPDNIPYIQAMLKGAYTGGYTNTTQWLADLLLSVANSSERPGVQAYILLKEAYAAIGQYEKAMIACKRALEIKPSDDELADELKRLSAELTVSKGKYDQGGDFRNSIKDSDAQRVLQASDGVMKSDDFRTTLIQNAQKQFQANPTLPQNIFNLANALAQRETDEAENEAVKLLEDAYKKQNDFKFKQRADEIKIGQLKRHLRKARRQGRPQEEINTIHTRLNQTQLNHWRQKIENYPTDLQAKYEYADKLLVNGKYDEAIPLFQEAQRDPRYRTLAMGKTGVCFFKKGWTGDAVEIFHRALDAHKIKDDTIAKDLQYNLGLGYEKLGQTQKALEIYRKIAQIDFGYRDVSKRVDALMKKE